MSTKLPRLAWLVLGLLAGPAAAQPMIAIERPPGMASGETAGRTTLGSDERMARGTAIIQTAIDAVSRYDSISARLRQQVNLYGHQLAGPGIYLQQGAAPARKFRMEMAIQIAERSSTISQVSDGRFLWIYENLRGEGPKEQPALKIVDLRRVRDAIEQADPLPPQAIAAGWLAFGGLPRMLADLQANFQFVPTNETYLGDVPVWELRGVWRTASLARLLPGAAERMAAGKRPDLSTLPPTVPHEVVLYIGKDDPFPYRVEYHRLNDREEGPRTTPVVTIEMFEVRLNGPIDASQFSKPANLAEVDDTARFLERLKIAGP